ncbi:MAG TPA: hypothetical protein P5079_04660 [Elusimicrobiota bacterium]|nr:hypothetical protein [Elusimicrobiota bacterium]
MTNALFLLERAERAQAAGRNALAERLLQRAGRRAPDDFLRAEIIWRRAEALRALGRFREALSFYWRAHALYRRCGVSSERLRALLGASACLRILGRFSQAGRLWRTVLRQKYVRRVPDPAPAECLLELALSERGAGRLLSARRLLLACLRQAKRGKDTELLRHIHWALGGTERFLGHFPKALASFKRAEDLARKTGDAAARAYALCGQAGTLRLLGRGADSYRRYRQAHGVFKRLRDPFGTAYGLCGMGNALRTYGNARRSIPLYVRSAEIYARVGDESSRAFALWGQSGAERRLGHPRSAARLGAQSLELFLQEKDRRGEIMASLGLARLLKEQGRTAEALLYIGKAAQTAHRAGLHYESALARFEKMRLRFPRRDFSSLFRSFGIPAPAVRRWQDLP